MNDTRNVTYIKTRTFFCSLHLQNELAAALTPSPISAKYVIPQVEAHFKKTNIPPGVAARNTRGPLLFKCCHATYNKETRQLEIPKGEYIGKTVNKTHRATDPAPKEEECNYSEDTFVNSNLDEIDSAGKEKQIIMSLYIPIV